jgi:hypothetical protein
MGALVEGRLKAISAQKSIGFRHLNGLNSGEGTSAEATGPPPSRLTSRPAHSHILKLRPRS